MPLTEAELLARDAGRDIGQELLTAVREFKAGRFGRKTRFEPQADGSIRRIVSDAEGRIVTDEQLSAVVSTRLRTGLSQAEFAHLLGVSKRTLQGWEQGRKQPSGAARTLLAIAARRPEVLRELTSADIQPDG